MTQVTKLPTRSQGLGAYNNGKETFFYYKDVNDQNTTFQALSSFDGLTVQTFHNNATLKNSKNENIDIQGVSTFRVSELGSVHVATYKNSLVSKNLNVALSKDFVSWTCVATDTGIGETGVVIPNFYENKQFMMVYGEQDLKIATSADILKWNTKSEPLIRATRDHFGTLSLIVGTVIPMEAGLALVYYARGIGGSHWSIHGLMLDKKNPEKILWQSETIWEHHQGWEGKQVEPLGMVYKDEQLISYWDFPGEGIFGVTHPVFHSLINKRSTFHSLMLKRMQQNPVIKPLTNNFWESKQTFNAAALYEKGEIHLVYRAIGDYDTSVLGYASSKDGFTFDYRHPDPIYIPTQPFEMPASGVPWLAATPGDTRLSPYESGGGGYGGCEDPRLTKVGDKYYLTYVAYDAANPPRVALSSISSEDFHAKRWNWETPVLISPPGVVDKNCVIFPEKIQDKFVIMHRIYPHILVDYVDSLDFDGDTFLKGEYRIKPSRTLWDSRKVGAGPPPLKTPYGWLLIYHAVGEKDSGRYKIGAMLLDLKDPTKVLARTIIPILSPDHPHDNEGFKSGVVYPCGAVIKDDTLFVYYGGADTVVCGAHTNINEFLEELMVTGSTNLKSIYLPKHDFAYVSAEEN